MRAGNSEQSFKLERPARSKTSSHQFIWDITEEDLRNSVKNGATITVKQFTSINDLSNHSPKQKTVGRPDQCHLLRQRRIRYCNYKSKKQRRRRKRRTVYAYNYKTWF